uniref:trace amine-associated receptor 1-like n=1 Tax=Monopterus albus TaxID=43700 RepID=UPI0009B4A938
MVIYIVFSSISLLTASLNLLVIISISHFRQLHTPTNLLVLSLAVADFLVGLPVIPFHIFLTEPCWFLGDLVCVLFYVLACITVNASVVNVVLISVDRYVAICDPLHYPTKITQKKVQVFVLMCWIYAVFYSFLLFYDNLEQPGRYNSCYGECKKSEMKAARTLGVLVAVFLMCYSPAYCLTLSGYDMMGSSSKDFVFFITYLNSCLNPVIYAFFYPWFRKSVKLIVTLEILQPLLLEDRKSGEGEPVDTGKAHASTTYESLSPDRKRAAVHERLDGQADSNWLYSAILQ